MTQNTYRTSQVVLTGLRISAPLAITTLCLWLLIDKLGPGTLQALPSAIGLLALPDIAVACALTALSFWAIGRYDAVAHRHFQTGIPMGQARRTGTLAVALSQTLGFGLFTSAVVRWRMLPDLSFGQALRLSGFVCFSFLMAMGMITAIVCLVLPAPAWVKLPAVALVLGLTSTLLCAAFLPALARVRRTFRLPSLTALGATLVWTALDLVAAAAVLFVLIPSAGLSFTVFLPVFLLAYGAALLSSAPGGVGPFELVLLALLPNIPTPELLTGILAYRILYYALPAMIAAVALIRPFPTSAATRYAPPRPVLCDLPAEAGISRQNGAALTHIGATAAAVWATHQSLTLLSTSCPDHSRHTLDGLDKMAQGRNLIPLLYKCSARSALQARNRNWQVLRIADEAVLNPVAFNPDTPACRSLRRKLRQSVKAGVSIEAPKVLPWAAMEALDAQWQSHSGRARGGTMGRYCPDYLRGQHVALAYHADRLVGYVSFHTTSSEWCLDLVRYAPDAPDGTMHLLVHHCIKQAAQLGLQRLSLAAVPTAAPSTQGIMPWITAGMLRRGGASGLRQFKAAFGPAWQPRYAAAPNRAALAIALLDILVEVHHPPALTPPAAPHKDDEHYELVLMKAV